jgi:heme-degrading monooxygenase HmoA
VIREAVFVHIHDGQGEAFEAAYAAASGLLVASEGYAGHAVHRCIERPTTYLNLVWWQDVAAHMVGFRESERFTAFRAHVSPFYASPSQMAHYDEVMQFGAVQPVAGVLEVALLDILPEQNAAYEAAFRQAAPLIGSIPGYRWHSLSQCIELKNRYLLLAEWATLEAHTVGFRGSAAYQDWRKLLHHFYDPFPTVEHYTRLA